MWVYLLKTKDEAFVAFKKFQRLVEKVSKQETKVLERHLMFLISQTQLRILGEDQQMYCWHLCTTVVVLALVSLLIILGRVKETLSHLLVDQEQWRGWAPTCWRGWPHLMTWLTRGADVTCWRGFHCGSHIMTWLSPWQSIHVGPSWESHKLM